VDRPRYGLRKPTRYERFMFKVFKRWPKSYVEARLVAQWEMDNAWRYERG
jgi:hypothetical protein